jgi:hypothetical protein
MNDLNQVFQNGGIFLLDEADIQPFFVLNGTVFFLINR